MKADRRFHGMRCVDNEDKTCLRSGAARVLPAANLLRGATVLAAVLLCVCAAQAAIVQTDTTYANVTDLNAQLSGTDLANVGQATFASHTVSTNASANETPDEGALDGVAAIDFNNMTFFFRAAQFDGVVTVNLDVTSNTKGYDISEIGSFAGWNTAEQADQIMTVEYSVVGYAGFTSLGTFSNVAPGSGQFGSIVLTEDTATYLAREVDALRFTYAEPGPARLVLQEIDVIGAATPIDTVPTTLSPGDQYRLAFVTSTTTAATSSNIADYNTFVNNLATTAGLDTIPGAVEGSTTWTAIGSTAAVNVRDNTSTTGAGTGIGIYLLNDTTIATGYTDLWDGTIDNLFNVDEQGDSAPYTNEQVWTGTNGDGSTGADPLGTATPEFGKTNLTGTNTWINRLSGASWPNTDTYHLFAMSGVLTVPAVWDASTDTNWSGASDATSWSGSTYTDGADAQFNGAGAGTVNITTNVAPGSVSVNDGGEDYTFAAGGGVITGGAALTKEGTGTLTINTANTYSGGTTLNDGTLIVANNEAVGTGTLTLAGGTLRTGSTGVNLSEATVVTGTTAMFSGGGGLTHSGDISGSGTLNIDGSASGAASGTVTIHDNLSGFTGTISYTAVHNRNYLYFGQGGVNVSTTATLETHGTGTNRYIRLYRNAAFGALSGTGGRILGDNRRLTLNQNTDTTYGGELLDVNTNRELGLTKNGSGRLTLTGQNSYEFSTIVNSTGTLEVQGRIGETASITVGGSATFEVTGSGSLGSGGVYNGGGSGSGNIANSGTFEFNSTTDQELSGVISGAGVLVKDNTSTLTLSGTNDYTGATTVSAGTLKVTTETALGTAAADTTVAAAATLELNYAPPNNTSPIQENLTLNGTGVNGTEGALKVSANGAGNELSSTITLGSDATINTQSRFDLGGTITDGVGSFTLTKTGTNYSNFLSFGGTADFSHLVIAEGDFWAGDTALPGGAGTSVTVATGAQLTTWGAITIANSPIISFADGSTFRTDRSGDTMSINGTMTLNGTVTFSGPQATHTALISSAIGGTGSLTKTGTNTTTLSGTNDYTGATTVSAGTLGAGSTSAFSSNSAMTVASGASLVLDGNNNTIASLAGAGTVENDNASAATLTAGDASDTTFSGDLQDGAGGGALSLIKTGAGTLILQDAQTYTGTTTVNAGTLQLLGTSGSINLTSTYQINNGSTLYLNDTTANFFLVGGSDDFTFGSNGGGTFSLNGNILWRTATIATTGGARNFVSGGAFNHQNTHSIIFDSGVGTDVDGIDLEVSTRVERGSIVKNGAGTVLLTNASNRPLVSNSITINDGTLEVGSAGQIDTSGGANGDWSGPLTLNNDGVFKHSSSNVQTLSGAVSGTGSVEKINGTAVLVLAGTSTYSGTTTLGDGAGTSDSLLSAGSSTGFSPNSAFTINSDGALFLEGFDNTIASLAGPASAILRNSNGAAATATLTTGGDGTSTEFAGFIQDGGGGASVLSLVKEGGGTMTLSGASSYTGTTTVSAGELTVTGATGSGAVNVSSGATLSGTGTIGGNVTISSGGILAPGL